MVLYKAAGGAMMPKHHAGVHLVNELKIFGNPRETDTWEDESENGELAKVVAKSSNSGQFALTVFQKILSGEGPLSCASRIIFVHK